MKWMICCYAGMTTSILGKKLEEEAASRGYDVTVQAFPVSEAADEAANMDLVLLGPHVRFVKPEIEKGANGTPIYVMAPQDFGTMNTKAIVDAALKLVSAA
ncbi:PTS sugar transporter subunit IIB [[Collinsella] massiliensis]|uniref:PTS EIIB type-3 domain-containing protein n=1 Tax=[Collinsella] massiliensis TaxID=1232426 RepID=A0A1Y3XR78_9ACTN|nr:hypothetical protein [[Collinsella] massiliensis]OUN87561.1 hypothetical protein B5G02_07370 [[Collinsella] massiliensis]